MRRVQTCSGVCFLNLRDKKKKNNHTANDNIFFSLLLSLPIFLYSSVLFFSLFRFLVFAWSFNGESLAQYCPFPTRVLTATTLSL